MTMRRFTAEEEQGLLFLLGAEGARWRPLPVKAGPRPFQRLAALGCAQLLQEGPMTRGRLTPTGRYFAQLLQAMTTANPEPRIEISGSPVELPPFLQLDTVDGH